MVSGYVKLHQTWPQHRLQQGQNRDFAATKVLKEDPSSVLTWDVYVLTSASTRLCAKRIKRFRCYGAKRELGGRLL